MKLSTVFNRTINILRGFQDGQKITFQEQGHESFGQKNSDQIFVVQ